MVYRSIVYRLCLHVRLESQNSRVLDSRALFLFHAVN